MTRLSACTHVADWLCCPNAEMIMHISSQRDHVNKPPVQLSLLSVSSDPLAYPFQIGWIAEDSPEKWTARKRLGAGRGRVLEYSRQLLSSSTLFCLPLPDAALSSGLRQRHTLSSKSTVASLMCYSKKSQCLGNYLSITSEKPLCRAVTSADRLLISEPVLHAMSVPFRTPPTAITTRPPHTLSIRGFHSLAAPRFHLGLAGVLSHADLVQIIW